MPDTMPERRTILVPLFLVAQVALVEWAANRERPPAPLDLSHFPAEFGGWKWMRVDPISEVAPGLVADRLLRRAYVSPPARSVAYLVVCRLPPRPQSPR